jgi:hypothetical protein
MAQAEAVLATAEGTRMRAYVVLSVLTCVRTEELRALTWEHVDLEGKPDEQPLVSIAYGDTEGDAGWYPEALSAAPHARLGAYRGKRIKLRDLLYG